MADDWNLFQTRSRSLTFATAVKYTKDALKAVNGLTFFYNPNWQPSRYGKATFPLCFFSVKSMHEVMETEVTHNTMLFYNDGSNGGTQYKNGLLSAVADNVVARPKQYQLEVILPYDDLTLLTRSPYAQYTQVSTVLEVISNHDNASGVGSSMTQSGKNNWLQFFSLTANPAVQLIVNAVKSLVFMDVSSGKNAVTSLVSNIASTPEYNKNSLEAIWEERAIVMMKMWNGWTCKYVVLTHIDITKQNDEEGIYEASIVCQEVPIITVNSKRSKEATAKPYSSLQTAMGGAIKKAAALIAKPLIK